MDEQRCPECSDTVSEEEKACHKFEEPITQPPEIPKSKQSVPTSVLWLAAVLIIVGLVVVGTLVGYVAFSSFSAEGGDAIFTAKPERLEDNSDGLIHLTPEKIIKAKGNDPEGWVAQQEGKEFIVTGPLLDVSASENGQVRLVKVGRGDGACYVFMLSPELFDRLDQITQGTEVCMRGVCVIFSDQPTAFILMNGTLMN